MPPIVNADELAAIGLSTAASYAYLRMQGLWNKGAPARGYVPKAATRKSSSGLSAQLRAHYAKPNLMPRYGYSGKRKRKSFRKGYDRTAGFYGFGGHGYSGGHEKKFAAASGTNTTITAAGVILEVIPNIATGTGESGRVGRYIHIKNWMARAAVRLPSQSTAAATSDVVRLILFVDTQTNGTLPLVTDLLESANWQSFNNLANRTRFRVLSDMTWAMNSQTGAGDTTNQHFGASTVHFNLPKTMNLAMEYDGVTGATAERKSNNLYWLLISRDGVCNLTFRARLRFVDN